MLGAHLATEVREFVCVMEIAGFCVSSPAYMFVVMLLFNTLKYLLTRRKVSAGGAAGAWAGGSCAAMLAAFADRERARGADRRRRRAHPCSAPAQHRAWHTRPPRRKAMCSCTRCG
jgi:hypothetical protein